MIEFPATNVINEPTSDQCSAHTKLGDGIYACWYPQMGGYVSHAIVMINDEKDGCFEAYVWHDGEFPFNDEAAGDRVKHIHHCEAQQFIDFGNFVKSKQV